MTVTLPKQNQRWPRFRVLTRKTWGGTTASGGGWAIQPMEGPGPRASGFILLNYSRCLLPQIGEAKILYRYGVFSGRIRGASQASMDRMGQGEQWDPDVDTMNIPDLTGYEIRIQAGYPNSRGVVAASDWRTVWWGNCEYQTDRCWGAASIPSGDRTYHCVDAFARTRRWAMDRHGFISSAGTIAPAAGHPGYNVSRRSPSQVSGNKDSTNSNWSANGDGVSGGKFTLPGAGNKWTDADAINEALTNHRRPGEPHWILGGATDLFNTSSPWPVRDGEPVFDVVTRICRRERGRGAVLPTWEESSPTGALTATLTAFAQTTASVTYSDPAASSVTLNGATARGTTVEVDLIGDHRLVPDSLLLGDPEQYRVGYLITQGEQIEVLSTLEHSLTLEPGWEAGEQADFLALDPENRISERWRPVYQLHRLQRLFSMNLSDGNGSTQINADYRCKDDGTITTTLQPNAIGNSAPSMIEIMDDLPLYDGYDYTGGPARHDGQTAAAFAGTPTRREPLMLIKTASDRYLRKEQLSFAVQVKFAPDGILVTCNDDQGTGMRHIGDTDEDLNSVYDYEDVVFTVGLRLPHRVRMATGDPRATRQMTVPLEDVHLWLAAGTAIWDLDDESADADGCPGLRTAGGATPGILRDDRSALARVHALGVAWYRPPVAGQTATTIRTAQWSLACCGDIPTGEDYDGGGLVYPTCGKVVTYLSANGQRNELNTPVSSFVYQNSDDNGTAPIGVSTWTTDWFDLDLKNG